MNKSEIFSSKSIYFFYIVCLVCVTCRRASFGTLCPPCGMIYRAIPLPYLWYWPSFVQPFSHISSFQSLNLFNLLHFSHLIKRCPGYIFTFVNLFQGDKLLFWHSSEFFQYCPNFAATVANIPTIFNSLHNSDFMFILKMFLRTFTFHCFYGSGICV